MWKPFRLRRNWERVVSGKGVIFMSKPGRSSRQRLRLQWRGRRLHVKTSILFLCLSERLVMCSLLGRWSLGRTQASITTLPPTQPRTPACKIPAYIMGTRSGAEPTVSWSVSVSQQDGWPGRHCGIQLLWKAADDTQVWRAVGRKATPKGRSGSWAGNGEGKEWWQREGIT